MTSLRSMKLSGSVKPESMPRDERLISNHQEESTLRAEERTEFPKCVKTPALGREKLLVCVCVGLALEGRGLESYLKGQARLKE